MSINALSIIPCKTDSCPTMGDYAIKKKMAVKWGNRKKGDIVLFDFNRNGTSDHIGIVISVNSDGSITTIEGNTGKGNNTNGGQVQIRTRYKSQVNYFVRTKDNKEVTADMVIATARSQVGIKESPKNSNKVKYNEWFYGRNISAFWCCTFVCWVFAHVIEPKKKPAKKKPTAPKPNPQGAYSGSIPKPTLKKGSKGAEVTKLQKFYEWYFDNVKFKNYGTFGTHTEKVQKAFQKAHGLKQTGIYGVSSCKKANTYKHKTNQQKLLDKMKELAWAYGTPKKKYAYKTGAPKAVCKKALKKYGWADNKAEMSDCGNNVSAVVREAGVGKTFKALHGTGTPFPKSEKGFDIVLSGKKVPAGFLKPGDIVRYKKQNGNQHAQFYFGDSKVCEASHHNRFFAIVKDEKKYNNSKIAKISTVQVLRAKE